MESEMSKLEELSRPLIQYINENHNPHTIIIIQDDSAEIFEGIKSIITKDFIKD